MWFRVLGPLELFTGDEWTKVRSDRIRSLLAVLLINSNTVVSTSIIIDELWLDSPPTSATNLVQQYVARLRKLLVDHQVSAIATYRGGYRLVLRHAGSTDVNKFEQLAASAESALRDGGAQEAALLASEALDLWRGSAFADVITSPSVRSASSRLEEQRVLALELQAKAELFCGRHKQLVPHIQDLVRQYPYREELWGQLMLALYRSGRQAEALAAYRSVYQLLDSELALEPGAPLKHLHRRMLRGDPGLEVPR